MLSAIKDAEIIELKPGAAAQGVLDIWHRLEALHDSTGISYFTSRPWQKPTQSHVSISAKEKGPQIRPTHVLYRSLAYPITGKPLIIGRGGDTGRTDVTIDVRSTGVSQRHCTIELQAGDVVLTDLSINGTFVDDLRIHKRTVLKLGQIVRVGTPAERFELIACVDRDET
jgi:pSer/pThr/pTyr-binding forkhead associated (FHA) protein